MPDGERVTTGSEPRRFTLYRNILLDGERGAWHVAQYDGEENVSGGREIVAVQEVEPGHDEQTEAALNRLDARIERANAVWQPDPCTVAAVVEALRNHSSFASDCPDTHLKTAATFIEERFKPSAPGGGNGH